MSSISVNTITDASGGATTNINGFTPTVSNMAGRNSIINGAMEIAQRGTSATVSDSSNEGYSTVDRWYLNFNAALGGSAIFSQEADAPAGFKKSVKIKCNSTASISGTQQLQLQQRIEGFNACHFGFGTSSASSLTLSWWMKTENTTAPISISVYTIEGTAEYAVYSVTPTTSWAKYSVTIPGSMTATINANNGRGFDVNFVLAGSSGGTYVASGDTNFTTTRYDYVNDIGNLLDNTSNAIYITGVQLEAGSVATPFEHRQYGQELYLCKRYFEIWKYEPAVGIDRYRAGCGWADSAVFNLEVQKRTAPTVVIGGTAEMRDGGNAARPITLADSNSNVIRLGTSPTSLTYSVATIRFASGVGDFISISAEL